MSKSSLNLNENLKWKEKSPAETIICTKTNFTIGHVIEDRIYPQKKQFNQNCNLDQYDVEFCEIQFDAIGQFDFYSTETADNISRDR